MSFHNPILPFSKDDDGLTGYFIFSSFSKILNYVSFKSKKEQSTLKRSI